jgi:prepilin-type N-terminal cleavage/methylation domain-containing protein
MNAAEFHPEKRNGFTLLEIMLALLVIAVGVVAVIGLLSTSLDTAARSHEDLSVVSFADMVLDYACAADFNEVQESGFTIPDYEGENVSLNTGEIDRFECYAPGFSGNSEERYVVTYRLDIVDESPNVKSLSLKVWPGPGSVGEPRRFFTRIYNWRRSNALSP